MVPDPATPVQTQGPLAKGQYQDPTALTTEKIHREYEQILTIIRAEIQIDIQRIEARLLAMDKALAKVQEYPTDVDLAVSRQREYMDEKFQSVDIRFHERDQRFDIRDEGNKALLAEQRAASEKAIEKSEKATSNELGNLHALITDLKDNVQRQELALSNRINTIESKASGGSALWALIVTGFVVTSLVVGIIVAIVGAINN